MTGLAVDTSGDVLSAALVRGDELHQFEVDAGLRHSEKLLEIIDSLFAVSRIDRAELDFACCMKGPGSFTGLRIGMATVKGLAAGLDIPFYALSTFDCMAASRSAWPGAVLPLIDAKQGRWYAAVFKAGRREGADMDADEAQIAEALRATGAATVLLCGTDAMRARDRIAPLIGEMDAVVDPNHRRGAARELALAAARLKEAGIAGAADGIGLDYIRKSEAEITRETRQKER